MSASTTPEPQRPLRRPTDLDWFLHIQLLRCDIYEFPPDLFAKETEAHLLKVLYPENRTNHSPSQPSQPATPILAPTPVRHSSHWSLTPLQGETRPNLAVPRTPIKSQDELDFIEQSPAIRLFRDVLTSRHIITDAPDRPDIPGFGPEDANTEESFQVLDRDDVPSPSSSALGLLLDRSLNLKDGHQDRTSSRTHRPVEAMTNPPRRSRSLQRAAKAVRRSFSTIRQRVSPPDFEPIGTPYIQDSQWRIRSPEPESSSHASDTSPVEFSSRDPNRAYFEFSNFSPHPVIYDGKTYPTGEHLHQSMKFQPHRPDLAARVRKSGSDPYNAIMQAHKYPDECRKDWWGRLRCIRMTETLLLKFSQHSTLRRLLLDTGSRSIMHISNNDFFWGCSPGPQYFGKNMLGKALQHKSTIPLQQCPFQPHHFARTVTRDLRVEVLGTAAGPAPPKLPAPQPALAPPTEEAEIFVNIVVRSPATANTITAGRPVQNELHPALTAARALPMATLDLSRCLHCASKYPRILDPRKNDRSWAICSLQVRYILQLSISLSSKLLAVAKAAHITHDDDSDQDVVPTPLQCMLPKCKQQVHTDKNGRAIGEYCSQGHREKAVDSGLASPCVMCLTKPQRATDHFCGRTCKDEALSKRR
ncbi:hypothetical protein EIP91_007813 [Steccherinum ochraceum]|uniref:NADAR domain-containing protein n=1 Tax=Steccherinum ochraceum TaxID=92696 RepID=A0A4R0RHR1_9APHY|nr:hypothetical protein EIP91_007813 [Steccherinum ochraceum]